MSAPATSYREGDVLAYTPDGKFMQVHCREGLAIVRDDGRAVDTYWGGDYGDSHLLTATELETASLRFNLGDYREVGKQRWETYAEADRGLVTAQHGLQSTYYVRIGSGPDLATQIENARERVASAEREVESARSTLRWRRDELAKLEAQASEEIA